MTKFFAVIKREYLQRVRTKFFGVARILGPVMMALFTVVPMYVAGIKVGGATRLAVVDQSGRVYERFRDALTRGRDESDEEENSNSTSAAVNSNRQTQMQRSA